MEPSSVTHLSGTTTPNSPTPQKKKKTPTEQKTDSLFTDLKKPPVNPITKKLPEAPKKSELLKNALQGADVKTGSNLQVSNKSTAPTNKAIPQPKKSELLKNALQGAVVEKGTFNQFDLTHGGAMCGVAASRALVAQLLQKDVRVDDLLHEGRENYLALIQILKKQTRDNPEAPEYDYGSHLECTQALEAAQELEFLRVKNRELISKQFLQPGKELDTYTNMLVGLASLIPPDDHQIGALLLCDGEFYSIVIRKNGDSLKVDFFDSHGTSHISDFKNAMRIQFTNLSKAATFLSLRKPYNRHAQNECALMPVALKKKKFIPFLNAHPLPQEEEIALDIESHLSSLEKPKLVPKLVEEIDNFLKNKSIPDSAVIEFSKSIAKNYPDEYTDLLKKAQTYNNGHLSLKDKIDILKEFRKELSLRGAKDEEIGEIFKSLKKYPEHFNAILEKFNEQKAQVKRDLSRKEQIDILKGYITSTLRDQTSNDIVRLSVLCRYAQEQKDDSESTDKIRSILNRTNTFLTKYHDKLKSGPEGTRHKINELQTLYNQTKADFTQVLEERKKPTQKIGKPKRFSLINWIKSLFSFFFK